ncbi:MAG: DNA topoisomerase IB [Proteobacteria bacterium]|nr:DNA topoisomerase IB [Pseudomonadota bacterium]
MPAVAACNAPVHQASPAPSRAAQAPVPPQRGPATRQPRSRARADSRRRLAARSPEAVGRLARLSAVFQLQPARPLRWVNDQEPGFRRVKKGEGFAYLDTRGRALRRPAELARIRALAIPPAYTEVWICASADGHVQATGRDARGRKQYRYHADWQARRSEDKFDALPAFGRLLPALRRRVRSRLAGGSAPTRERVLAALVRLLDTTGMRVGNTCYARTNGSYGLSTLRCRHVRMGKAGLRLAFVGKSGVRHDVAVDDARLVRLMRRCADLPGQHLFQYVDDAGESRRVDSTDINDWLAAHAGAGVSAKVFRTWHASVAALELLLDVHGPGASQVVKAVAARLGNTPAVCRKAYIHPSVMHLIASGEDPGSLRAQPWAARPAPCRELRLGERRLLALLAADSRKPSPATPDKMEPLHD